jgi:glycosyltransferase involved in cell wall biosynthesis
MIAKKKLDQSVSVVVPTYNRENEICRAIDSVLAQTRPADEIIVVDDGSTDETESVIRSQYNGRVRYIRQENKGVAAARNNGIWSANHDLVAFLDSDDAWSPSKLQSQLPLMKQSDVVLSATDWIFHNNTVTQFNRIGLILKDRTVVETCPLKLLARFEGSGLWLPTFVCRKDALIKIGGFQERFRIGEDTHLILQMAHMGAFGLVREALCVRGQSESGEQLTKRHDNRYHKEQATIAVEIFSEAYVRAVDAPFDVQKGFRRLLAFHLTKQARYLALDRQFKLARRKAIESLVYFWRDRNALRSIACVLSPRLFLLLSRSRTP